MNRSKWSKIFAWGISGCWLAALASSVHAVNIRHDVADAAYLAHGAQAQFDATIFLEVPSTDVTGTIVGDGSWVLTAAHPVDGGVTPGQVSFTKNAVLYTGTQIVLHPGWGGDPFSGNDIALVKLNAAVAGVTPAVIYTGNAELTEEGSLVGFGRTGTGAVGDQAGQGTLRGAQNVIDGFYTTAGTFSIPDGIDRRTLFADFDAPAGYTDPQGNDPPNSSGSSDPLGLEGNLNVGDSGSPLFIEVAANVWRVAGVGSAIFSDGDGKTADYGDASLWTRVSTSSEFILETIPEPNSAVLAALGGLALGVIRRRSQRRGKTAG